MGFEVEDHGDAGEVESGKEQVADVPQPLEVVGTVAAGAARRPIGFEEAARFVQPQVLHTHADEFGCGRDAVYAAGALCIGHRRVPFRLFRPRSSCVIGCECCIKSIAHTTDRRVRSVDQEEHHNEVEVDTMLMRTDPFRELDRLTQQVFGTQGTLARPAVMPMDAWRDGDTFVVELDVPGVNPGSIDLDVERNVVTVRAERPGPDENTEMLAAERPRGVFSRQLVLGDTLDTDHITASYDAGVLTLKIPVAEKSKPRKITIGNTVTDHQIIERHSADGRQPVPA